MTRGRDKNLSDKVGVSASGENPLRGEVRLATGVLLFGGAGEDRTEDGEQEDVGAGEWAELRFDGGPKAGDDDGKFAAGEQRHSGSEAGWPVHSSAVSGPVTREDFRKPGDNGEQESDPQDRRQTCRINLKAEEEKERGGEEVAKRGEQTAGVLGHLSGDGDANEKCADGRGYLETLRDAGDEKDRAKGSEKDNFIGLMGEEAAEALAKADGDEKHQKNGDDGNGNGYSHFLGVTSGEEHGDERQIDRHSQILENQDGEDDRSLRAFEAAKFGEHFGDDARGRDVSDTAEEDGSQRLPAEQESGDETGREVKGEISESAR